MARQRMVNPVFFQDDDVAMLSPWARLLFVNLWCLADREGRLEDKPGRIKAQTFPFDATVDVESHLQELVEQRFICRYERDGRKVIQIRNFLKYQHPHHKEAPSILPGPAPESPGKVSASTDPAPAQPVGIRNTESESESVTESESESSPEVSMASREPAGTAAVTQDYRVAFGRAVDQRVQLRGGRALNTVDFHHVQRWIDGGIPLRIVLRGIDDCSPGRNVPHLAYCVPAIDEAIQQWGRAVVA